MSESTRPRAAAASLKSSTGAEGRDTVVITGGASGIGFETARILIERTEHRLALVGKDVEKLRAAATELNAGDPERVTAHVADLADSQQVLAAVDKIRAVHRSIHGLVNNAGVYPFGGVTSTKLEDWNETFQVNLTSAFLLMQALAPLMAKNPRGGRVVNVSSTAGMLPNHFALAYSVSKAALIHLTRTAAKELGKDNVTVNCVCPGIVRSPLHEAYHASRDELDAFYARRGAAFPLGRVGEPSDIAAAIAFYLSPDAAWITGDVMVVDGGRLLL